MKIIKKINNNVAECIDGNGKHLIAFGRGIGFPKMPYDLNDLSKISMTFYKLDTYHEKLIAEITEAILVISSEIVDYAQRKLKGKLNPTLVFSLADHINFAIKRLQNYQQMKFYFSYEFEQLYPVETELAKFSLEYVRTKIGVKLPKSEISSIAMHFVNSQQEFEISEQEQLIEQIIEDISVLIEQELDFTINREEFNYNRFQMHVRYFLKRLRQEEQFMDDNEQLFRALKETNPKIFETAEIVSQYISSKLEIESNNNEKLYLMIHISRIYEKGVNDHE